MRRQLSEWIYRIRYGRWCPHQAWGPVIRTDRMRKIQFCLGCRRKRRP